MSWAVLSRGTWLTDPRNGAAEAINGGPLPRHIGEHTLGGMRTFCGRKLTHSTVEKPSQATVTCKTCLRSAAARTRLVS